MTTIALDATHIVWDSQITMDNEKMSYPAEKVWIANGAIYAFAGDYGLIDPVIKWHVAGARASTAHQLGGDWDLLCIRRKGAVLYTGDVPHPTPVQAPFAMGSGAPFARGAMMAGATAYQAVQIACKCDVYSGGEVNSLALADAFRRQRRKA